jgi:hypothetical protein
VSTVPSPAPGVKTRRPPRPPKSWSYDPLRGEVVIFDCNNDRGVYRVLLVPCDTGRSWELISVDHRFGESRTVHLGEGGVDDCCDCPGFCWASACKHLTVMTDLVAGGVL